MHRKIKLYCSTNEPYPLKLVDVVDLFLIELNLLGVEQEWFAAGRFEGKFRRESIEGVSVIVSPWSERFGLLSMAISKAQYWILDAAMLCRFLWKPVDIIQVRDKYVAALIGLLVARIRRRRFVVWLSFPFPEYYLDMAPEQSALRRIYGLSSGCIGIALLYKIVMPRADVCFVQSEQMRLDLHRVWGVPLNKMKPVAMGISRRSNSRLTQLDSTQVIGDRNPTVLYVGTLAKYRRLETMIEAFLIVARRNPLVHFQVVGDGEFAQEREGLEEIVQQAGMSHRIEFTGFLPIDQAWGCIRDADICVSPFFPSRVLRVASPTKLVEYLSFGKPTVANHHPEHDRVIAESSGGVLVDWSADGFARGIQALLDHPEQARQMGLRGLQWVGKNRTYDRIARQVQDVFVEILEQ